MSAHGIRRSTRIATRQENAPEFQVSGIHNMAANVQSLDSARSDGNDLLDQFNNSQRAQGTAFANFMAEEGTGDDQLNYSEENNLQGIDDLFQAGQRLPQDSPIPSPGGPSSNIPIDNQGEAEDLTHGNDQETDEGAQSISEADSRNHSLSRSQSPVVGASNHSGSVTRDPSPNDSQSPVAGTDNQGDSEQGLEAEEIERGTPTQSVSGETENFNLREGEAVGSLESLGLSIQQGIQAITSGAPTTGARARMATAYAMTTEPIAQSSFDATPNLPHTVKQRTDDAEGLAVGGARPRLSTQEDRDFYNQRILAETRNRMQRSERRDNLIAHQSANRLAQLGGRRSRSPHSLVTNVPHNASAHVLMPPLSSVQVIRPQRSVAQTVSNRHTSEEATSTVNRPRNLPTTTGTTNVTSARMSTGVPTRSVPAQRPTRSLTQHAHIQNETASIGNTERHRREQEQDNDRRERQRREISLDRLRREIDQEYERRERERRDISSEIEQEYGRRERERRDISSEIDQEYERRERERRDISSERNRRELDQEYERRERERRVRSADRNRRELQQEGERQERDRAASRKRRELAQERNRREESGERAYARRESHQPSRLPTNHLTFKRFDGATDYNAWYNAVSRVFNYLGWGDNDRRQFVPTLLDERALSYFEMIDATAPARIRTYEELMDCLSSHFAIDRQGLMATAELHARKQGAKESVAEYSKSMYEVFAQLNIPPGNQQAIHYFKGLRPRLQLLVGRQDPRDLDSAERSAIQMERVEHEAADPRIENITQLVSQLVNGKTASQSQSLPPHQTQAPQGLGVQLAQLEAQLQAQASNTSMQQPPAQFQPRQGNRNQQRQQRYPTDQRRNQGYDQRQQSGQTPQHSQERQNQQQQPPPRRSFQQQQSQRPDQQGANNNNTFCKGCNIAHPFGQHVNSSQQNPPQQGQRGPIVCFNCGEPGHIRTRCPLTRQH